MTTSPLEIMKLQNKISIIRSSFHESRKNSNCILELEELLLSEDEACVYETATALTKLFSEVFSKEMLSNSFSQDENEEKYRQWLLNRYNDFVSHLLQYLSHTSAKIQEKSLDTLIAFMRLEGKNPLKSVESNTWYFPRLHFQEIIKELLSFHINQEELILKFQKYTTYDDVKFYTLKCVNTIIECAKKVTDIFLENCFHLLCSMKYPEEFCSKTEAAEANENTLLYGSGVRIPFYLHEKIFCKLFSSTWRQFLKYELPPSLLRKVLVSLHEKVLPHLQNPSLMTDFLTNSYTQGGVTSLLSLNGLFFLMQKYNVEYPDFYANLYALFDENIVNGKFNARFFHLSNLFLSSTHLPACIVASFAKKISRISLSSKTDSILKIIPFVCNLLVRHPTLNILIHRTDPKELSCDPFDIDETDPAESKAMESSLWEIKALQCHLNPLVSRKAKVINHSLPRQEYSISEVIGIELKDVYRKERKRRYSEVHLMQKSTVDESWWIVN